MSLIFILIALGLDFWIVSLERFRHYGWFMMLFRTLEKRLGHYTFWSGPSGLILLLALPVVSLMIVTILLDHNAVIVEGLFALFILIYCFSPGSLQNELNRFIEASKHNDEDKTASLNLQSVDVRETGTEDETDKATMELIVVVAHRRLFAVIFWFLILGPVGALLYQLTNQVKQQLQQASDGFIESATILLSLLEWPSSKIMIVAMALAGSLSDVFPGWKKSEHLSLNVNDALTKAGLAALQYTPENAVKKDKAYWVAELQALMMRTLLIYLVVLGIMTLFGELS